MLIYSTQNTNMVIKTNSGEGSKRELKKGVGGGRERVIKNKIGRNCRNIMSKMWVKKRIQDI